MPSDKSTRKQRHQAAIKPQKGKAVRGAQATEFVKGAGYRKSEFIGGKKFYTPMSSDPTSSGAGGDVTNITVSGGTNIQGAVLADGTVPFNSTQVGISPTETSHLATKGYVDSNSTAFELTGNVTGGTSGATAVPTTIADNTISQAKMLDNSVGTAEILNDNVTYAKIQNIAGRRFLGRNTNSSGDAEEITTGQAVTLLALESGSADEYLCGNGTFREVSASTSMAGLNDTAIQSLSDGQFMRYQNSTSLWKNVSLVAGDIPNLATSKITSGTFDNARISSGSVTQHQSSLTITKSQVSDFGTYDNYSSWTVDTTAGSSMAVNSGDSVTFQAGSGATVSQGNTGSAFTVQYALDLGSVALSALSDVATGDQTLGTSSNNNGKFLRVTDQGSSSYLWDAQALVAGDIPTINISSGTTGTLPVNRGGTGTTSGYNNSNWDTAYGWGNHASAGYQTSQATRGSLNIDTDDDVRFDSFGVGTNASGTTGEIRATNEITAYYSDDRLKDRHKNIENALSKIDRLNGFYYSPNSVAESLGYDSSEEKVGVSAQEVLKVLPEAVTTAPIDSKYHAVQYDKLIPLIIEAIKELNSKGCGCGSK